MALLLLGIFADRECGSFISTKPSELEYSKPLPIESFKEAVGYFRLHNGNPHGDNNEKTTDDVGSRSIVHGPLDSHS